MRRVLPWLMFLVMEAVLISLGVWQLQRKDWKEELLAMRARNAALPALPLSSDTQISATMEYRRVKFACAFTAAGQYLVEGFDEAKNIASRRYVKCVSPLNIVVDLGWIAPDARMQSEPAMMVAGRLRFWPEQSSAQALGGIQPVGPKNFAAPVAPFYVQQGDALPQPPPNNHFAYAIQWFIFAGVLCVIFMLFQRWQKLAPRPPGA